MRPFFQKHFHEVILRALPFVPGRAVLLYHLENLVPEPRGLRHVVLGHRDIRALDRLPCRRMLGEKAILRNGLFALDPSGCAHRVPFEKLLRNEHGASALLEPLPCLFVNVGRGELLPVLLFRGEHAGRLWHVLALQVFHVLELDDRQLMLPRIAFGEFDIEINGKSKPATMGGGFCALLNKITTYAYE